MELGVPHFQTTHTVMNMFRHCGNNVYIKLKLISLVWVAKAPFHVVYTSSRNLHICPMRFIEPQFGAMLIIP
jgi:hypothetical protein